MAAASPDEIAPDAKKLWGKLRGISRGKLSASVRVKEMRLV
jgi:hypothetical protein